MTRAGLVLLCGYFEGFLREMLEEAVDCLNDAHIDVERVPAKLMCSLVEEKLESVRSGKADAFVELFQVLRSESPPVFRKRSVASTGGNPTVDVIESLFDVFSIEEVLDRLSISDYGVESTFTYESQVSQEMRNRLHNVVREHGARDGADLLSEIVLIIERRWAHRRKRRPVGYISDINELLKRRNRIAHGESQEPITPEDLLAAKTMVLRLSEGLHRVLEAKLAEFVRS